MALLNHPHIASWVSETRRRMPALLASISIAALVAIAAGQPTQIWLVGLAAAWLTLGSLLLNAEPPPTLPAAYRLLPRALIWPWFSLRGNAPGFSPELLRTGILALGCFAAFGYLDNAPAPEQLPPTVGAFVRLMWICATVYLVIFYLRTIALIDTAPLPNLIRAFAWRALLFSMGIASIAYLGNDLEADFRSFHDHPGLAVLGLAAWLYVSILFRMAPSIGSVPSLAQGAASGRRLEQEAPALSALDRRRVATHEAGHFLVFAAVGALPDDFKIVVQDRQRQGSLGFIFTADAPSDILLPAAYHEWKMLLFLAGQAAEQSALGETTSGALDDLTRWQEEARKYLASGLGAIYFLPPADHLEVAHNQATLDALRASQRAMLKEFFNLNAASLDELAKTLEEKGELGRADLLPLVSLVKFPPGFPKLADNILSSKPA